MDYQVIDINNTVSHIEHTITQCILYDLRNYDAINTLCSLLLTASSQNATENIVQAQLKNSMAG